MVYHDYAMGMTKVEVVQAIDRRKGVRQAVEALGEGFVDSIKGARSILLKVDLGHDNARRVVTHVDAVRGVLDVIRHYSRAEVYVGDAGYYATKSLFRDYGYEQLPLEYAHTYLVDLHDDAHIDGYTVRADGTHNPIRRSKLAATCEVSISLAPLAYDTRAHLTVENWALGTWLVPPRAGQRGMVWTRAPWLDGEEGFHASIAALYAQLSCQVAIIDGIDAVGAVLAGRDAVAVDAIASTLMGIDPAVIGYLHIAMAQGLGTMDMAKIDVPPLLMSELREHFKL